MARYAIGLGLGSLVGLVVVASPAIKLATVAIRNYLSREVEETHSLIGKEDHISSNDSTLVGPLDPTTLGKNEGRVAGRVLGMTIRKEMGLPSYTSPNLTVAMQRISMRVTADCPNLRFKDRENLIAHAVYYVFTPSTVELKMFDKLHTLGAASLRNRVRGCARPRYRFIPDWIQMGLGLTTTVAPGF